MLVRKRNTWVSLGGLALAIFLAAIPVAGRVIAQEKAAIPSPAEKPNTETCLGCHGPFEELAKWTAGYVTDQGEKVNPHVHVPHDSDKITPCDTCHEAHLVPLTSKGNIPKANVQYCYSACHHNNDFTPCIQCHKDKK